MALTPFEIIGTVAGASVAVALPLYPVAKKVASGLMLLIGGRLERIETAAKSAAIVAATIADGIGVNDSRTPSLSVKVDDLGRDLAHHRTMTSAAQDRVESIVRDLASQSDGIARDVRLASERQLRDFDTTSKTLAEHGKIFELHDMRLKDVESVVRLHAKKFIDHAGHDDKSMDKIAMDLAAIKKSVK